MAIPGYRTVALVASALLSACAKPAITLPADPDERAAACHAAGLIRSGTGDTGATLGVPQANEAAHFLLLGASIDGIAQPARARALAARGQALQAAIREAGTAADYAEPCARAYPETLPAAFKGLPADSADTRMMCFALADALVQIYRASDVRPDDRSRAYAGLDDALGARISAETGAAGEAEPAVRVARGLALGARAGPPTMVMDACVARYLKP